MIASLRGRLMFKDAAAVVVDCGGVGYGVSMSLSALTRVGEVGQEVSLLVYTHVGQEVLRLYGFLDAAEKRTFEVLIGLSGVGPKLALAILSTMSPDELRAVVSREDLATLVKVPGVGKKTAQRLLLELRDRLEVMEERGAGPSTGAALREDLVSALENLGFNRPVAEKAADATMKEAPPGADLPTLVRTALRASTKL